MTILGVDVGTTGMKMGIFGGDDSGLNLLGQFSREYEVHTYNDGLFSDIDPVKWRKAFAEGCHALGEYLPDVDVIALSGTTPGLTAMNREGEALYPAILMLDQRSREQARHIIDTIGMKELLDTTSNMPVAGGCSLASIQWIKDNHPEWLLLDVNGAIARFANYPYLIGVDLGDPVYQRIWTANAIRLAKMVGADGIKIDNINSRYDWNFDVTLAKYPDRASYMAAMDSFVRYAVAEIHRAGLIVIGNGSGEDWDTPPWSEWIQLFDGRESERTTPQDVDTWRSVQNSYRRFPDKLYVHYLRDPAVNEQFFRFQLLL